MRTGIVAKVLDFPADVTHYGHGAGHDRYAGNPVVTSSQAVTVLQGVAYLSHYRAVVTATIVHA